MSNYFKNEKIKDLNYEELNFIVKIIDYSIHSEEKIKEYCFSSEEKMEDWLDNLFLGADEFIHSIEKRFIYTYNY